MARDDDIPELPTSTRSQRNLEAVPSFEVLPAQRKAEGLTQEQVGQVIEIGGRALESAAVIGQGIVEIYRIREEAAADVDRIDAETRRIQAVLRGEVERMESRRGEIRDRGEVMVSLIREVAPIIRDSGLPESAKRDLIAQLPEFLKETFAVPGK